MSKFWKLMNRAGHTAPVHHAHHLAYCVYYGIALTEDHGLKLYVVTVLFAVALLATVTRTDLS